jgi:hypothetical protein
MANGEENVQGIIKYFNEAISKAIDEKAEQIRSDDAKDIAKAIAEDLDGIVAIHVRKHIRIILIETISFLTELLNTIKE